MNARFVISMTIAIVSLGVGFYLLSDVQQEKQPEITQESLDNELNASNQRLAKVKDQFYNGMYHGDLTKEKVIQIINDEIEVQKRILQEYKELQVENKPDKTIDMRFFQLQKYSWAGEISMIKALEDTT